MKDAHIHTRMLADLREAAETLRSYESHHRAKHTAESTKKAAVNAALAERLEATIEEAQRALALHNELITQHVRKDVWYWQNDGHDHLESMVNSLPVVIRADQLRGLIEKARTTVAVDYGTKKTVMDVAEATEGALRAKLIEMGWSPPAAPRPTIKKTADAAILEWLQRWHTLHYRVEMLYVVDGYEVTITYDDTPVPGCSWKQPTLYDALREAARAQPEPPVRGAPR